MLEQIEKRGKRHDADLTTGEMQFERAGAPVVAM